MRYLDDIPAFPEALRHTLVSRYGIETAEAFYAHAARDPGGLANALDVAGPEVDRLARLVEGYLPADYVDRCHAPTQRHPRGVIPR